MSFVKNMKLTHAILLMVLIPTLFAAFFASQKIIMQKQKMDNLDRLSILIELSVKMSSLVHEQQKERGATAVFLGTKGKKFVRELKEQRKQTDAKITEFMDFQSQFDPSVYDNLFQKKYDGIKNTLAKLENTREATDNISISTADAIGYYTGLNGQNLELIGYMANLSSDPRVVVSVVGYTNFLQGKERAGIERAVGAGGFSASMFTPTAMDKFKTLIGAQATYNDIFVSYATDVQKSIFRDVMSEDATVEVTRMRKIAVEGGIDGDLQGIDGKYWFKTITHKINGLKRIENSLSNDILEQMLELKDANSKEMMLALGVALVSILMTVVLSVILVRTITSSIQGIVNSTTALAQGHMDVDIPAHTDNEVGEIVDALKIFMDNAKNAEKLKLEQQALEQRTEREKKEAIDNVVKGFQEQVGGIIDAITVSSGDMKQTAQVLSSSAAQATNKATTVAKDSEAAAANVQTVAAASEEMSVSIREISSQVNRTSETAAVAVKKADHTNQTVKNLHDASKEIGEIINLINDIAEQTNLLALNATIEAARAGEAGKGFAVVATEVKSLASQTAQATESIGSQIAAMQATTTEAVTAIEDIRETITSINESAGAIAVAIDEQTSTTAEISRSVQDASAVTGAMTDNLAEVKNATVTTGQASEKVLHSSEELSVNSQKLEGAVEMFLNSLKQS